MMNTDSLSALVRRSRLAQARLGALALCCALAWSVSATGCEAPPSGRGSDGAEWMLDRWRGQFAKIEKKGDKLRFEAKTDYVREVEEGKGEKRVEELTLGEGDTLYLWKEYEGGHKKATIKAIDDKGADILIEIALKAPPRNEKGLARLTLGEGGDGYAFKYVKDL